MMTKLSRNVQQ